MKTITLTSENGKFIVKVDGAVRTFDTFVEAITFIAKERGLM